MAVVLGLNGDDADALGCIVDELDALIAALSLPIPHELHVKGLAWSIKNKRDKLREILTRNGFDPWDDAYPFSEIPARYLDE